MKASSLTKETIMNLGVEDRKFPDFGVGDQIEVSVLVKEGNKERAQAFRGDVIARRNNGISQSLNQRKTNPIVRHANTSCFSIG